MGIIRSQTLYHILPEFIERIRSLFPEIKKIEHSNEIFKDGYTDKAYMVSSDSSGVHVYFYNITSADILLIIDNQFETCSVKIKEYFNILTLYNQLLYNVKTENYNISVNLIDNMAETDDLIYKVKAMNQKSSTILLMFHDYYNLTDKDILEDVEDNALTYSLSFKNDEFYDYLVVALNKQLSKYIDIDGVRSNNIQEYINLVQMLKI
jgi:hypothetical protein